MAYKLKVETCILTLQTQYGAVMYWEAEAYANVVSAVILV
jgi:hypothetical protein